MEGEEIGRQRSCEGGEGKEGEWWKEGGEWEEEGELRGEGKGVEVKSGGERKFQEVVMEAGEEGRKEMTGE